MICTECSWYTNLHKPECSHWEPLLDAASPGQPLDESIVMVPIEPPAPGRHKGYGGDLFGQLVGEHLSEVQEIMVSRHRKYGPGNISEFGELGLLVRLGDKFARLKNNQEDFSDESVDDTVSDIIGYSLIWKMWRAGDWPAE